MVIAYYQLILFNSFKKHKDYPYNKQFYDKAKLVLRKEKLKVIL